MAQDHTSASNSVTYTTPDCVIIESACESVVQQKERQGHTVETLRWTSHDLEYFPDDETKRYEIVDGELYVSKQPHWDHQLICSNISHLLAQWSNLTQLGVANFAPGLIFSEDNDVAPDLVWISRERLETALWEDGKLHTCPELLVEVLSPGSTNERRDREAKLKLYSRRGADEYWIIDWRDRCLERYRRENAALTLSETLRENDTLQSPLLPGFNCEVSELFKNIRNKPEKL